MNRIERIETRLALAKSSGVHDDEIYFPIADLQNLLAVAKAAVELCTGSMVPERWIENKKRLETAVKRLIE